MVSRRIFLKGGGVAVLGLSIVPGFVYRMAMAAAPALSGKTLVTIFQRGGVDGLNVVVPFGEKDYYGYRPSIAVPAPSGESGEGTSALDLDGFFGLHPAMQPLLPLYKDGQLAIVHAAGSPHPTRSHFDAQDFMESAAPGDKSVSDGWLNRYLVNNPDPAATTFRGVSLGPVLPRSLEGPAPALALGNLMTAKTTADPRAMYQSLYDEESNSLLSGTSREMFDAIKQLKEINPNQYETAAYVQYPNTAFGFSLRQVAQLIKAKLGLEVVFMDVGGWDTHTNQGAVEGGRLPAELTQFGQAIAAFHRDLGDLMQNVVVLTMSEFGRTARENGSGGTDHGKANVMFVLGGAVRGGKVYGDWPGLASEQLNEDRDLALTTDFRDVFAEVLVRHLGCQNPGVVFPDYPLDAGRFRGVL